MSTQVSIVVSPLTDDSIIKLSGESEQALVSATNATIRTLDDVKMATNDLSMIANLTKQVKACQDTYIRPIKGYLDAVKVEFNSILNPLDEATGILRQKVLAWNLEQADIRRKQEDAERLSREAAEAEMRTTGELTKSIIEIENKAEPIKHVSADVGSAGMVKNWKWEPIQGEFDKVPNEYKMLNSVLIGQVVRSTKGQKDIPGIRIYSEDSLRITAR